LDMVPDFVNKFTSGNKDVSPEAIKMAEEMAAAAEKEKAEE
ncbi:MAG TPA: sporulation protein, partial [Lachnoclostridium sp.]|nr:sporulation protein [Lachnoclostridium sp.]